MPTKLGALVAGEVFTHTIGNAGLAAWTTWTPSYTNLTIGNGTVTARYAYAGRTTFVQFNLLFGSTTSVSGLVRISGLPVAAESSKLLKNANVGLVDASGGQIYPGSAFDISTTSMDLYATLVSSTYANLVQTSSTVPFTWTTSDEIQVFLTYEATS